VLASATASLLDDAHRTRTCLEASGVVIADLATAYEIQGELTALRRSRGARRIGWKLGYTSQVMRDQLGVREPNHGPLLSDMAVPDGGRLPAGVIHPRVEPEVALVLASTPQPGSSVGDILDCCASARAALEVVDSVWCRYEFDLAHNTADGSSAAHLVLGPEVPLESVDRVRVTLLLDGDEQGSGVGADAAGHPALAVSWLVDALAARGEALAPGDVVLTGGLTAAVAIEPGCTVSAVFTDGSGAQSRIAVHR